MQGGRAGDGGRRTDQDRGKYSIVPKGAARELCDDKERDMKKYGGYVVRQRNDGRGDRRVPVGRRKRPRSDIRLLIDTLPLIIPIVDTDNSAFLFRFFSFWYSTALSQLQFIVAISCACGSVRSSSPIN